MRFEVLPAHRGECFLIHGDSAQPALILIDGGPAGTYAEVLRPRLFQLRDEEGLDDYSPLIIDLIIVSHTDADHIDGLLDLFGEMNETEVTGQAPFVQVKALWYNGFERILGNDAAAFHDAGLGLASFAAETDDIEDKERREASMILASVSHGERLDALAASLNIPINPEFNGHIIETPAGQRIQCKVAGINLTVVGPLHEEISDLQRKYDGWLTFQQSSGREITRDAMLDSLGDSSVASSSSIVVLAEQHGRSALITGDARSDKIIRGLEDAGFLDERGTMEVDILKMPHHGSDPYIGALIERVHAHTYVFSGNGDLGGPDPETIEAIMTARAGANINLCFAEPIAGIDTLRRERNEKRRHRHSPRASPDPAIARSINRVVATRAESILASFSSRKDRAGLGATGGALDLKSFGVMHEALGSETLTQPWTRMLELREGHSGAPLPDQALRIIGARTSERDNLAWIDIAVAPGLGKSIWLALNAEAWEGPPEAVAGSFAVLLPHDLMEPINVRLEFTFEPVPDFWQLAPRGLTARLAEPEPGGMGKTIWGPLWEAQRNAIIFSSAQGARQLAAHEHAFVEMVIHKRASPLAAAIGAAILIRANLLDSIHSWPRNIANWFPEFPDGPVLWAETLLRRERRRTIVPILQSDVDGTANPALRREVRTWLSGDAAREALAMYLELDRRGPPLLGPALAMAVQQAQLWTSQKEAMATDEADKVTKISAMIQEVAELAEPETLFASFRSSKPRFLPLGAYRHSTR